MTNIQIHNSFAKIAMQSRYFELKQSHVTVHKSTMMNETNNALAGKLT